MKLNIRSILFLGFSIITNSMAMTTNLAAHTADRWWRTDGTAGAANGTTARIGSYTAGNHGGLVAPFWIPNLNGQQVTGAELQITIPGSGGLTLAAGLANADVYGVRSSTNSTTVFSDYTNGTLLADNWFNISSNLTSGVKTLNSSTLANWIGGQVGTNGGQYVFITIRPDAIESTYRYATVNTADETNGNPVLILTTAPVSQPIDVRAYDTAIRDVWTNGTVKSENATHYVGRKSNVTNGLTACVMAFDLPDLNGASIISAKLKFRVNSVSSAMNATNYANINIEAVRVALAASSILSNDYRGIGLRSGEAYIQTNAALWNDGFPRDYETTGAATNTLGAWLSQQYAGIGAGNQVVFRLAPSRDVAGDSCWMTVPTTNIQLIITTDGRTNAVRGFGRTVSARIGPCAFSWTLDRDVEWGYFIDGQPWIVRPASGLYLVSATPARLNDQTVNVYGSSTTTNADINITVVNPPFDYTFDTNTQQYVENLAGVCGWDSRYGGSWGQTTCGKYNPALGWNGMTWLPLFVGDSITTPKSTIQYPMPDRATPLDALAVLTVLSNVPPADAFRPGVIRTGTDRTNPEILCYSNLVDLSPYLIASPVGDTDLKGGNVTGIEPNYTYTKIRACLPGPGFKNTSTSKSEGSSARFNNCVTDGGQYGGTIGVYMGQLAIGSLADWLTPEERKICQIRFIQRAIDTYSAVKSGLTMATGAGILPGNSTLITVAGVMMNHQGMKGINANINGVKPWFVFADYATCWHTDGVSTNDLAPGETQGDRLVPLYYTGTDRPLLNKTNAQPIASASASTMTVKTNFYWAEGRPINNVINLKLKITSGAGAGPTIYVITNAITAPTLPDSEKFRTAGGVLYDGGNEYNFCYGGKVGIKPVWQNGTPDSNSVFSFSVTTSDTDNPSSDNAEWYWKVSGSTGNPVSFDKQTGICTSPQAEYAPVHAGGTIGNLIALYALGQQDLYKGGIDKYLINSGARPGYGEVLFGYNTAYLDAIVSGTTGNTLGALWKQEVLSVVGANFEYTDKTSGALDVPHTHAKMWYEP